MASKLAELAYEDRGTANAHIHVASVRHRRLRRIARHAERKFGLSVREFPPYDDIDPVHATCSWHYRWPGKGVCAPARVGADRTKPNLALDASGVRMQDFFDWVLRTYGRPDGWYQP
jgi:hypothetical protein